MPKDNSGKKMQKVAADKLAILAEGLMNRAPVKSKIPEREWNFSSCPTSHLRFCQKYEYGRSSNSIRNFVDDWRASGFARADQPLKENVELEILENMDFFRLFPEFPKTPWLDLPGDQVKARLAKLPKRTPILVRSVGVSELFSEGEYRDVVRTLDPYHTCSIQPIEVNWFFNDKLLISAFKTWLKDHRRFRGKEERGGQSPKELLKALAAWRLLKHHTAMEADEITGDVLGKPLFRSQSDWLDAKSRADDVLEGRPPQVAIGKLWVRLDKKGFTEEELNALWQYWITLTEAQSRQLYRLKSEVFTERMRAFLKNRPLT